MKAYQSEITDHLDLLSADNEEAVEGETKKWQTILIHGDPTGLRSLAQLLLPLADAQQEKLASFYGYRRP